MDAFLLSIDYLLFGLCLFILAGSTYITICTKFVQKKVGPALCEMVGAMFRKSEDSAHTVAPHKALMTAMSTTLGISTIVGPFIAVRLGGPGALLGFLLAAFIGAAATYVEVKLSIEYRKKDASGKISGGPMQYLKVLFSPKVAAWYALSCFVLMMAWSAAQANQLAAIFDSPLLGSYRVPVWASGVALSVLIMLTLVGGIKRIAALSSKLVPTMFVLYVGASFWIILSNLSALPALFASLFSSLVHPTEIVGGAMVGGVVMALRWGIFKGTQASEAGVGTQSIPHSAAETEDSDKQGSLAMISTCTAGAVAFLSGMVALITGTWADPDLPIGISMVASSFQSYFSTAGIAVVSISAFLFGFGTILGNSYNGGQAFDYLFSGKGRKLYLGLTAIMIVVGAISSVTVIWSVIDLFMAAMAIPHMTALVLYAHRSTSTARLSIVAD